MKPLTREEAIVELEKAIKLMKEVIAIQTEWIEQASLGGGR